MGGTIDGQFNIGNALTNMGQQQVQTLGNYASLNATQLANQQMLAEQAAARDYQSALGPNGLDQTKYNALLSGDKAAAIAVPDAQKGMLSNQGAQLSNQNAAIINRANNINFMAQTFQGYMANPAAVTPKSFQNDMVDYVRNGGDPSEAAQILAGAPTPGDPQWASYVKQEGTILSGAAGQINAVLPQTQPIPAGGQTIMGDKNPLSSTFTAPGTVVTNSPSAEFQNTPVDLKMPDGSTFTGTPVQALAKLGVTMTGASITPPGAPAGGGMPSGFGAAGLTPVGPQPASASQPAAGGPGGVAPAPAAPASPPASGGGIVVPAGAAAAATSLATDQMTAFSQDVQAATNTGPAMSSIQELGAAARGFKPGPLAANLAELNSLAGELNLPSATDAASAEQTATKAAGMIMASNLGPFGTPTNDKLGAAMGITPNGSMSAEGLAATSAMAAGMKLYQLRLGQAAQRWQASGGQPANAAGGYNSFKLNFQNQTSPAVLALQFMPPSTQKDFISYVKTLPAHQQQLIDQQVANTYGKGGSDASAPAGQ